MARAGVEKQVQLVLGKGEQLPFADATFDALTFTYLLRYVEDPRETLRESSRGAALSASSASQQATQQKHDECKLVETSHQNPLSFRLHRRTEVRKLRHYACN